MMLHNTVLELCRHSPTLTLLELSLFRITTTICNNQQLLNSILNCNFEKNVRHRLCTRKESTWQAVQAKANELVSQIRMPVLLKNKILEFLWPVSYRILLWKSVYAPGLSNTFLQRFYWTDRGRVDNTRTVRGVIGNRNISVRERFLLACSACLSEEIHEIWKEMPIVDRNYFYNESSERLYPLIYFWGITCTGSNFNSFFYRQNSRRALGHAIDMGLLQAFKYLFAISAEYEIVLDLEFYFSQLASRLNARRFIEEDENDIGYFLFSKMTDSLQAVAFNKDPVLVLSFLLHSSEYKPYLNLLEKRLLTMDMRETAVIIRMVFYTYHLEVVSSVDCGELSIDLWRIIPFSLRSSIVKQTDLGTRFLSLLIRDNFPFILEKEEFQKTYIEELTSRSSTSVFDFHQEKWKLLLFLIKEEIVTVPYLETYNRTITNILNISHSNMTVWNRIIEFVRKVGSEQNHRKE